MVNFGKIALATFHVYIHLFSKIYMLSVDFPLVTQTSTSSLFKFDVMYKNNISVDVVGLLESESGRSNNG
jgi:hypothetical protein